MNCRARTALLAARRRGPPDDLPDLLEVVVEHVVEQENRPLDRCQPLEQDQERHRQRVGLLDEVGRIARALVGHERFREPLADIRLAADPGGLEVVDREVGDDSRQVCLR
jgi:hypothetical protein